MKALKQSNNSIFANVKMYEPEEVFKACIAKNPKVAEMMYMYSDNEHVHYFKDSITRKYTKVDLRKSIFGLRIK